MSVSQMKISMDANLMAAGNAVLAKLDYTPSKVVSALWEYVSVEEALPPELANLLCNDQPADTARRYTNPASGGAAIVSSFYERVGIPEPTQCPIDYDELRELAELDESR